MIYLKTIVLSLVGVALAVLLQIPVPFLLGPLFFLTLLSFLNVKLVFIDSVNKPTFALLGIYLGSTILKSGVTTINSDWVYTTIYMIVFTFIVTVLCAWYFYKFPKYSKEESLLAGVPGALAYIVSYSIERGDILIPKIIITQTIRVLVIVGIVPWVIRYYAGYESGSIDHFIWEPIGMGVIIDLLVIIVFTFPISLLLSKLKAPNVWFLGGMLGAAFCYSVGLTDSKLPSWIVQIILVLIGTIIGLRLSKASHRELLKYSVHGFVSVLILLILTVFGAYIGTLIFPKSFMTMFLAFAPGGVHEMSLIAIVYFIEPLFVTFHHMVRIVFISFIIPFSIKFR